MLKSNSSNKTVCVSQVDHGAVAGVIAAQWGNDEFARPGFFAPAPSQDELREEVILGIAQHDNGWLEWEAAPPLDSADGLPHQLFDALAVQSQEMKRWRLGIGRFSADHPYASLLTSLHVSWLYMIRTQEEIADELRHALWWNREPERFDGDALGEAKSFMNEIEAIQAELQEAITKSGAMTVGLEPQHLSPHVRLLQVADAISLSLCSGVIPDADHRPVGAGESRYTLTQVPRQSWQDRVDIDVVPLGDKRYSLSPYPFEKDELKVSVPCRVFPNDEESQGGFVSSWYRQPFEQLDYTLVNPN